MRAFLTQLFAAALVLGVTGAALANGDSGRTLVVGSEEDYLPFATGKPGEEAGGFTVELWKAVVAENDLLLLDSLRSPPSGVQSAGTLT